MKLTCSGHAGGGPADVEEVESGRDGVVVLGECLEAGDGHVLQEVSEVCRGAGDVTVLRSLYGEVFEVTDGDCPHGGSPVCAGLCPVD